MLNYLVVCPADGKGDLCSKIADVVEKYAPDKRWHVDTLITTISIAGNDEANDRIVNSLVCLITQVNELHPYIVHKMYHSIKDDMTQRALVHVGIWCIGEYGQLLASAPPADESLPTGAGAVSESEVIDLVHKVMRLHSATVTTKSFCLNALLKLTTRCRARILKAHGKANSQVSAFYGAGAATAFR